MNPLNENPSIMDSFHHVGIAARNQHWLEHDQYHSNTVILVRT